MYACIMYVINGSHVTQGSWGVLFYQVDFPIQEEEVKKNVYAANKCGYITHNKT